MRDKPQMVNDVLAKVRRESRTDINQLSELGCPRTAGLPREIFPADLVGSTAQNA
jgi:hypothetical protein